MQSFAASKCKQITSFIYIHNFICRVMFNNCIVIFKFVPKMGNTLELLSQNQRDRIICMYVYTSYCIIYLHSIRLRCVLYKIYNFVKLLPFILLSTYVLYNIILCLSYLASAVYLRTYIYMMYAHMWYGFPESLDLLCQITYMLLCARAPYHKIIIFACYCTPENSVLLSKCQIYLVW